jgi:uncharacterized protein
VRNSRRAFLVALALVLSALSARAADAPLPELTEPVNDFAHVIDATSAQNIDRLSRALKAASGDVVVVATIPTFEPYADIREYAVKLFENHGKGIGEKGKDNGVLILVAIKERKIWIEVGYGLEQWITDGFSGETSRNVIAPEFRGGRYGAGLQNGTARIVARIAEGRNVTLRDVDLPQEEPDRFPIPLSAIILIIIVIIAISRASGGPRRGIGRWGSGGWSGWYGGVGPFGGGWGGGGWGGGGFGGGGGGFGGFGGGRSGGGGGGAGW